MPHSYALLLCVDYSDPNEVLNLVDDIRQALCELDPEEREKVEARCARAEMEIHARFTPMVLWSMAAVG